MLDETARVLPTLYDSFIANCWEQKDRILPLRMKTTDGLLWAKICALTPDLIYIDAGHDFIDVLSDLTQAHAMFPQARIVGDDFDWRDPTRPTHLNTVKLAVQYFAAIHNFQIRANRTGWTLEPKSAPVPAQ